MLSGELVRSFCYSGGWVDNIVDAALIMKEHEMKTETMSTLFAVRALVAVAITCLCCSLGVAQSQTAGAVQEAEPAVQEQVQEANPATQKMAGTWSVDLVRSKEMMSEDGFKMMSEMGGIKLMFGAEGEFTMAVGPMPPEGGMSYTAAAVEGEENTYAVEVERSEGNTLSAKVIFMDENTVKFIPEGEDPAILVREVAEEEAEDE